MEKQKGSKRNIYSAWCDEQHLQLSSLPLIQVAATRRLEINKTFSRGPTLYEKMDTFSTEQWDTFSTEQCQVSKFNHFELNIEVIHGWKWQIRA